MDFSKVKTIYLSNERKFVKELKINNQVVWKVSGGDTTLNGLPVCVNDISRSTPSASRPLHIFKNFIIKKGRTTDSPIIKDGDLIAKEGEEIRFEYQVSKPIFGAAKQPVLNIHGDPTDKTAITFTTKLPLSASTGDIGAQSWDLKYEFSKLQYKPNGIFIETSGGGLSGNIIDVYLWARYQNDPHATLSYNYDSKSKDFTVLAGNTVNTSTGEYAYYTYGPAFFWFLPDLDYFNDNNQWYIGAPAEYLNKPVSYYLNDKYIRDIPTLDASIWGSDILDILKQGGYTLPPDYLFIKLSVQEPLVSLRVDISAYNLPIEPK